VGLASIDQLWYTWSAVGLRRTAGWQVRAASPGLSDLHSERYRSLERYFGYSLPEGVSPLRICPDDAPLSLALVECGRERALLQRRFIGTLPQRGPGIYFVHAIAGVPEEFSWREAIGLWRSAFWAWSADDLPSNQLTLPTLSVSELRAWLGGGVGEKAREALAGNEALREYLPFVIEAFLALAPGQQLFIAAPPDTVIQLLQGLGAALPDGIAQSLSFSTYEREPRQCGARIVGTTWQVPGGESVADRPRDLPMECYNGRGLGLNCFSGRSSDLPAPRSAAAFARFAADCLYTGAVADLQAIVKDLGSAALTEDKRWPGAMLSRRDRREGPHLVANVKALFSVPVLASRLIAEREARSAIISAVLEDAEWWEQQGRPTIERLRAESSTEPHSGQSIALLRLGLQAIAHAIGALRQGDVAGADRLVHSLALVCAPTEHLRLCRQLLDDTLGRPEVDPEGFPWPSRAWLLTLAGKHYQDEAPPVRWLHVPGSELGLLLALPLPRSWLLAALRRALVSHLDRPFSAADWDALLQWRELFEEAALAVVRQTVHPADESADTKGSETPTGGLEVLRFLFASAVNCPQPEIPTLLEKAVKAAELAPSQVAQLLALVSKTDDALPNGRHT